MASTRLRSRKRKKVVKFKRIHGFNIGVIIFLLIFAYIVIYVGTYFSRDRISVYEVIEGKSAIMKNKSYTGFAVRNETVVGAESPGCVNFYVKDGSRVSKVSTIYTLDESGKLSELLATADDEETENLSKESQNQIRNEISQFVSEYNNNNFESVYEFKYDLNSLLLECMNLNKLNSISSSLSESIGNFQVKTSPYAGIVEFYTDGYENYTMEDISEAVFKDSGYNKVKIASGDLVEAGSPLYKVINSEDWYVVIQISEEEAQRFSQQEYVTVRFLKDNLKASAGMEVVNSSGNYYAKLSFKRYMVKYADYRYLDIQILGEDVTGLKIPKSATTKKSFYTIPKEYICVDNKNDECFKVEKYLEDGSTELANIYPDIYFSDEVNCYVAPEQIDNNTLLVKMDSMSRFQVGSVRQEMDGVYNVNSGYTEFEAIKVIGESNDYYIVSPYSDYGVQIYDHIVLDASMVKEKQIVFR